MKANKAVADITWKELRSQLFTPEEIAESDLRVALMGEIINARKERGITQQQLEEMTGVKQSAIARMESGRAIPQMDTVIKILAALGKKLTVVPV